MARYVLFLVGMERVGQLLVNLEVSPMKENSLLGSLLFLLVAVGFTACGSESEPTYSGGEFAQLSLRRSRGMGFCIDKNAVIRATVSKDADGVYSLSGFRAVEGDPQADSCQLETFGFTCMVEEPFGPITVSSEAIATLAEHVAAVPAKECVLDKGLACDPCVVTVVEVDGQAESADCCGEMSSAFSAPFAALVAAIEALAPSAN